MRVRSRVLISVFALCISVANGNEFLTEGHGIAVDASRVDGSLAIDLEGDIWLLDARGGEARRLIESEQSLRNPRWSPGGGSLLYLVESGDGTTMRIRDLADGADREVGDTGVHNQDATWHPGGERIVYVTDRHDSGLDVWETDLPTGLSWRLTADAGDELSPAWSGNGRHLAWIRHDDEGYALMLRLHGEPATELLHSAVPLSSLAWRPDGSLLTYLRHGQDGITLEMAILSDPVLVRTMAYGEQFVASPVSWRDRMRLYYTADGQIRTRGFEDRVSRPVHFRAMIAAAVAAPPPREITQRELTVNHAPDGRTIIHAARLFDGIWQGYRTNMDVVIDGGRIESIEPHREREDGVVLDLGDVTVIPGLIDAAAALDEDTSNGESILAYGVTTIAVESVADDFDPVSWESESTPGPRVIVLPPEDVPPDLSGLADGGLGNIHLALDSRQARTLGQTAMPARRFASMRDMSEDASSVVAGSAANGLPPGLALHAELLALRMAGLTGEQVLYAAGRNAARALGVENQVGVLTPGSLADLVVLRGDPIANAGDALKIVAIVRNGRFLSLVRLLEAAAGPGDVE